MKRIALFTFTLTFTFISLFAQNKVKGYVYLKSDSGPLEGITIIENNTGNYAVSDFNGEFQIDVASLESSLKFRGIGYKELTIDINGRKNIGRIYLEGETYSLSDVIITSSIAAERITPVSVSSITGSYIAERLSSHEFTEVLKYTPGVHANRQGGGWGDSEIYMRGFDNSNIAVIVNGVQINDMESGTVYWSDWANLSDVAATVQTQRGIGTSKISSPSVGGTINIVTKGNTALPGGSVSMVTGSHGYNKLSFAMNSGLLDNGWSLSLLGSRTYGNGYFQGGDFEMYSYFVNASKSIGNNHQFMITAFGAPQKHYSRNNALTYSEWQRVRKSYALKDWREYNPDYGFDANGKRKTADYAEYHKPFVSISHNWDINENSKLNTNIYAAFGRGGSYSGKADEVSFSEYDWYGSDYGILNQKFRAADGTYDYAKIESINKTSDTGSKLIMTQIDGKLNSYGFTSTYYNNSIDGLDLYGGISTEYFVCSHTNRLIDLYGGEYYIDPCRQDVLLENNPIATDGWKNEKLGVGDVIYRDYDTHVMRNGIFSQIEFHNDRLSAFLSGSISRTTYWKEDRFYYGNENSRSDNAGYFGGTVKGGVNYNINANHNIYLNTGYISRAPHFKSGAFMSPTSSNVINDMAKNEKSCTVELGYGFQNEYLSVALNGYFTEWINKTMTKKGKIEEQYYINMSGVNSQHMGMEFELKARPVSWIEMSAMLSIGDWKWDSDKVKGYADNLNSQAISFDGNITTPGAEDHAWAMINMKDIKVGGSAQTTASFEAVLKPFEGLRIGGGYSFFDRNYAYYSLSGGSLKIGKELYVNQPWRIPSYGCLDLHASYQIEVGKQNLTVFCNMNNVLDMTYIEKAWNPSNVSSSVDAVNPDDVYMFYALGRNWTCGIKVKF